MARTRKTRPLAALAIIAAAALIGGCSSTATGNQTTTSSPSSSDGSQSSDTGSSSSSSSSDQPTVDGDDTPVPGGNLTVQISQDPGSLDVNASGNISTGTISKYLFEKLFDLDASSKPQPVLATGYTVSDDGLTYTFTLREGIVFSDGTPMTSKDVVASLTYWMANSSYGKPIGEIKTALDAPDDHTVTLSISKKWPVPLIIAASDGATVLKADIVSTLDAKGFDKDHAIGTGPYKLKSWAEGDTIVLERNDKYQSLTGESSAYTGARHAYLDTITFKVVADNDAALNGLTTGQWDVMTTPTADQYDQISADANLKASTTAGGNNDLVFLNDVSGIMANQDARDGLNLIMDKSALMTTTGNPALTTVTSAWAVPDNADLYSEAGKDIWADHDPAKGKALLESAGLKAGTPLRIITTGEFPQFVTWATELQAELKAAGVEADVQTYDFGTMIDKAKAGDWDIMTLFDGGDVVLPQLSIAVTGLMPFLGVSQVNPEMQALIDQYAGASPDDAHQIGEQIQALVWKQKPSIVMGQDKSYIAYTSKLKGYDGYKLDFWNSWLEN